MEEVSTTDLMVILMEEGRCRSSSSLLIRTYSYDTTRDQTVIPLHQIKIYKR